MEVVCPTHLQAANAEIYESHDYEDIDDSSVKCDDDWQNLLLARGTYCVAEFEAWKEEQTELQAKVV
jgi:hypothetical protein